MFENVINFFKKIGKKDQIEAKSKDTAKERLHLVLMQDRANVSADFLELMKQEIIEVIKKYIDVDESAIDVRLTNKENSDGTNGAPALYANIPILNIKNEARKIDVKQENEKNKEIEKKNDNDKKIIEQEEKEEKEDKEEKQKEQVEEKQEIESNVTKKANKETKNDKEIKNKTQKENSTEE